MNFAVIKFSPKFKQTEILFKSRYNLPPFNDIVVKISDLINQENRKRAIIISRLHYRTKAEEVVDFLKGHGGITAKDVHLEQFQGRKTGIAAVIFKD